LSTQVSAIVLTGLGIGQYGPSQTYHMRLVQIKIMKAYAGVNLSGQNI